jgi:predicted LPLAT superfamily acyltransferase
MHSGHAKRFNGMIARSSAQAAIRIIEVSTLGIETATELQDAIANGDWVVISADRIPVSTNGRVVHTNFLNHEAAWPQGPYILASLLRCPVYSLFSIRNANRYHMVFELFAGQIDLPRKNRTEALQALATRFARSVEAALRIDPLQWYNFYDFWASTPERKDPK